METVSRGDDPPPVALSSDWAPSSDWENQQPVQSSLSVFMLRRHLNHTLCHYIGPLESHRKAGAKTELNDCTTALQGKRNENVHCNQCRNGHRAAVGMSSTTMTAREGAGAARARYVQQHETSLQNLPLWTAPCQQ